MWDKNCLENFEKCCDRKYWEMWHDAKGQKVACRDWKRSDATPYERCLCYSCQKKSFWVEKKDGKNEMSNIINNNYCQCQCIDNVRVWNDFFYICMVAILLCKERGLQSSLFSVNIIWQSGQKQFKQRQKQSERQMGREAAAVSQSARAENSLEGTAVTGELPGEAAAGQWMPGNEWVGRVQWVSGWTSE